MRCEAKEVSLCPCGHIPELEYDKTHQWIYCPKCGKRGEKIQYWDTSFANRLAIDAWNVEVKRVQGK